MYVCTVCSLININFNYIAPIDIIIAEDLLKALQ